MIFPVVLLAGGEVTLGYLGRDNRHSIEPGQWVELVDDDLALREEVRPLGKVKAVDHEQMSITVEWPENPDLPTYDNEQDYKSKHVLLRRWDHTDRDSVPGLPNFDAATGTLFIEEAADAYTDSWLTLENGIRISFTKSADEGHYYRSGDYWLIPARTATGDVEWPWQRDTSGELVLGNNNKPVPEKQPPHGVEHHYAPLAMITWAGQGEQSVDDCRRKIIIVVDQDTDLQIQDLAARGSLRVTGDSSLGGRVGLGMDASAGRLTLNGVVQPNQGTLTIFSESTDFAYDGGSDDLFIFQDNGGKTAFMGGNVGIGTTTPSVKLEVAGDLKVLGNAYKSGGGGWTGASDEKLKKNVKSLKGALDALLQLRGVSFEWKEPEKQGNLTGSQIGMVAQDVEKVFPAWVGTSPDGMKNITFRGFEALTVEALRELSMKMEELSQRVQAIEQRMSSPSTESLSSENDASETKAETKDENKPTPKSTRKKANKKTPPDEIV
jgi:hypothetical protein